MPSQLNWLTLLLGAFFVSSPVSPSLAQPDSHSLQQVIASLDSTSPVLAAARVDLARARAAHTSSRAFPNPALFGTQETLNDAINSTERIIGVRQDLGFLWSQSSRYAATKAAYEAAQAAFVEIRRELTVQVMTQAYEYDRLRQQSSLLDSVLARAEQLSKATTARRKEGDIAPYDEQRFLLEQVQLQNRKQESARDKLNALSGLVRLTGLPAERLQRIELISPPALSFTSEDEAVRYALDHRPELTRTAKQLAAARRALAQARWRQLPEVSLGVGTKTVDPGPGGLYAEGELELPLWNQRRGEKNIARSELARAELHQSSQLQLVEQEVRAAFQQLQLVDRLRLALETGLADSANLNTARGVRLYLEGEMSALELVDALRTGIEAQDAALRLRNSLAMARAELRRVAGIDPVEP
ncbi:TolC family protein [candidate division KSB1 bacterium]|nr:TolC family protein [candidate division KSB1 bacterium]